MDIYYIKDVPFTDELARTKMKLPSFDYLILPVTKVIHGS